MKKYSIKRGDTLENLSQKLGINVFDLKNYHNNHCELENLIGDKLPSHLKEILYFPKEETIRQEFSKIKENTGFNLLFNPPVSKSSIYKVQVSYFENEAEQNIKFQIQMDWLNRNLVRITRTNLYINYEEPNLQADLLSSKIAESLYPLELIVNSKGEITQLHNYPEIKKRWKQIKENLIIDYTGEAFEKYIGLNEYTFSDEHLIYNSLKKDWFLQAYFNGLYQLYSSEPLYREITFPLIPSIHPVQYEVESRLSTLEEEDEKLILIEMQGEICDERTPADFENESSFPALLFTGQEHIKSEGGYKAKYFLDIKNQIITGLYLECTLKLEKLKKAYITLSEIKNTDKNKNNLASKEEGIIIIGQKEKTQSSKSSFLFD